MGRPTPVTDAGRALPVPSYLSHPARSLVPWARRYTIVTRHGLDLDNGWSETMSALLRAAVYFRPAPAPSRLTPSAPSPEVCGAT
jgi:hypothetical protein